MAILNTILNAGSSLIGGITGNRQAKKAANTQYRYQLDLDAHQAGLQQRLNEQAFGHQVLLNREAFNHQTALSAQQNHQVNVENDRIERHNRDILDNHSTSVTTTNDVVEMVSGIDFNRLRKDAEAAGFNPVSVLRMGGLAGYSTSNTRTASTVTHKAARELMSYHGPLAIPQGPAAGQAHAGYSVGGQAPSVQFFNPIGDALKDGLAAWQANSPAAKLREELERNLVLAQIRNYDSDSARNRALSTASYTGSTGRVSTGGIGGAVRMIAGGNGVLGGISTPEVGKTTVTNPWGGGATVDPNVRDTEQQETRYGDIIGAGIGAYTGIRDITHNLNRVTGNSGISAGNAVKSYLQQQYDAMKRAWNNPALNANANVTLNW